MIQLAGAILVGLTILFAAIWVWLTFFKGASVGQSTVGKYITSVLQSAQLSSNLGMIEVLSHVDAIEASPEATAACSTIADCLWSAAKDAWKAAATKTTPAGPVATATVKIRTVDGLVVEVPSA